MSNCTIQWNTLALTDWDQKFARVPRSTLLQSFPYSQAMRKVHQQKSRYGLIHIDGKEAGLCQMQEVGLFKNTVHAISLDRGPAWFEGYGKTHHWAAFLQAIDQEFPARFLRKRRIMPELQPSAAHTTLMQESAWTKNPKVKPYQTIWLDLRPDLETLRANLHQKWRNALNKSEKKDLILDLDMRGDSLSFLLRNYMDDRLKKNYPGPSPKMVNALCEFTIPRQECFILNAIHDQDIVASILILKHGQSATYQIGWNGSFGRDASAHHFLLWNALGLLKDHGVHDFDLGGINDETAAGVKAFKTGLKGQEIALIGQYS